MERIALGYCRISAKTFDAMTPKEVQWRIEAEQGRENREFERIAQLACWVINPWITNRSDRYTVGKLLRRHPKHDGDGWKEWVK